MKASITRRGALLATGACLVGGLARQAKASAIVAGAKNTYRDTSLSPTERAKALTELMTIEEKTAQMRCMWSTKVAFLDAAKMFDPRKAADVLGHGIGQIARISDIRGDPDWDERPFRSFEDTVRLANDLQRFLVEKTRLGIPALFHDELAHGLLANEATVFPIPPALGSTWDPELVEEVFTVAAREARVRGTTIALTPVIDLMRDPRWGRSEEMFGEDPVHVARMAVAAVRGLQGRQRPLGPERVFATLKHFVHGSPQGGLNISPADMSERTLREAYLVPFKAVMREADPAIVMPSYNELMGVPAHANVELLQSIGRRQLGFTGMYMSDYEGIGNLVDQHHVAATKADAAVLAVNAGIAADLPEGAAFSHIPELVAAGRITADQVDRAVEQILALKFEAGLFENPYIQLGKVRRQTGTSSHMALARKAAARSMVLLKNDGLLPLAPTAGTRLAVIGPGSREALFGGYSGDNASAVGVFDGLRKALPASIVVDQADGVWLAPPDTLGKHRSYSPLTSVPREDNLQRIAQAVDLARRSDVVVLVVGDIPAVTREAVDVSLPGDRSNLSLWGMQDELVDALAMTGKPIVALLLNGRPLAVANLAGKANALIEGWYLGQEGGNAAADILLGKENPGGKLPVTFARSVGELPAWYNRHPSAGINRYIEGGPEPLFPFGHGLSYTKFLLSPPELSRSIIKAGEGVTVSVRVTNAGARAGDEVVQLYLRDDVSSVPRPILELKAFERITLNPGESRNVVFELRWDDFAFWDAAMKWGVEPGDFTISTGNSSAALTAAKLTVQ